MGTFALQCDSNGNRHQQLSCQALENCCEFFVIVGDDVLVVVAFADASGAFNIAVDVAVVVVVGGGDGGGGLF